MAFWKNLFGAIGRMITTGKPEAQTEQQQKQKPGGGGILREIEPKETKKELKERMNQFNNWDDFEDYFDDVESLGENEYDEAA